MTLIKSISGIRGTIGGPIGEGLTPIDIVKFTYAYCATLPSRKPIPNGEKYKIVVGRDARISGQMVEQLVCGTLISCGVDVVKCGFASTPTTELAVKFAGADGGIILTASHNPSKYNGYKVYGADGCQITSEAAADILSEIEKLDIFADVRIGDFEAGVKDGNIQYISDEVYTAFVNEVKNQSVLFGEDNLHNLQQLHYLLL